MKNETKEDDLNHAVGGLVDPIVRLRPVFVRCNGETGLFHVWGAFASEDGSEIGGVVELEDGTCSWYGCDEIKFKDRGVEPKPEHTDIEKYGYSLWYSQGRNSWYASYEAEKGTAWYAWRGKDFISLNYSQVPNDL